MRSILLGSVRMTCISQNVTTGGGRHQSSLGSPSWVTIVKGHSDAVDSALYAFRESPAYAYTPPVKRAVVGTPEHDKETQEAIWDHQRQKMQQAKEAQDGVGRNWDLDNSGQPSWNQW